MLKKKNPDSRNSINKKVLLLIKKKKKNVSQLATGPKSAKKSPLAHAQSANKLLIGSGNALHPEGEGGLPIPRWPCWMTGVAMGFWWLPPMRCLSPSRSPAWSLTWQVRKPFF